MTRTLRTPLALTVALLALVGLSPGAHAATVFSEGWETANTGWTHSGNTIGRDCTVARTGSCSLKVAPACCGTRVYASHILGSNLDLPHTVSFAFRGPSLSGGTDTQLHLDTNAETLVFAITRPGSLFDNNGMSLDNGQSNANPCGEWTLVDRWYTVVLVLDGAVNTVAATVTSPSGTVVGTCTYPFTGTQLTGVSFNGFDYGGGLAYHYDDLLITT